jgi:hypothetical protein
MIHDYIKFIKKLSHLETVLKGFLEKGFLDTGVLAEREPKHKNANTIANTTANKKHKNKGRTANNLLFYPYHPMPQFRINIHNRLIVL